MKQRTQEWHYAKLGIVSASRFKDVVSSAGTANVYRIEGARGKGYALFEDGELVGEFKLKKEAEERKKLLAEEWKRTHWSDSAYEYLSVLLAELWTGMPRHNFSSPATEWGEDNEPEAFQAAIPAIQELFGQPLYLPQDEYAFILHPDEPGIGCSPDGIIGDQGLLEIKCPYNAARWVRRKLAGLTMPNEFVPQVQGSLWVTGRKWYAFVYYDGRMRNAGLDPLQITKVERDDNYIDNELAPRIIAFRDWLRRVNNTYTHMEF